VYVGTGANVAVGIIVSVTVPVIAISSLDGEEEQPTVHTAKTNRETMSRPIDLNLEIFTIIHNHSER
jgi:hypothetical protein